MRVEGSSHVEQASYDPAGRALYVRFKGGNTYRYMGVPPEKWDNFQTAERKGKFIHSELIPHHRGYRVQNHKWDE